MQASYAADVGNSEWFQAANSGDAAALSRILSQDRAQLNATDEYGQTALQIAARLGFDDAVKVLVEAGAPLEQELKLTKFVPLPGGKRWFAGGGDETPLWLAIEARHVSTANVLLAYGANPGATDKYGNNLLGFVCDPDLAKRLVAAGLDPNLPPKKSIFSGLGYRSDLGHAVTCGNAGVVRALLSAGAGPNHRDDMGMSPLDTALQSKAPLETIRMLIDAEASVVAPDKFGRTPLMFAANFSDDPKALSLLLDAGADIQARDRQGRSATHYVRGVHSDEKLSILKAFSSSHGAAVK